ncbi:hypothetical protein [Spirosoma luteum]|uniref:hypothetical protein n=1 Tax=Spirosoma luteum TaxID=431553 RepID=UPI00037AA81E|nr:hypothetical protein [Spirosoma luteum]
MSFHNQSKNSRYIWVFLCFLPLYTQTPCLAARANDDYLAYHRAVIEAETAIAAQDYTKALSLYVRLFDSHDFVFLRDYKIATQLALYIGKTDDSFVYLKKGITSGWTMKSIKKNKFLGKLQRLDNWKTTKQSYDSLRSVYQAHINPALRKRVQTMFRKDQWKAIGALFTLSSKAQQRYAERKFAPHSEKQLAQLNQIISTYGYPGERLIGNNYWTSTILSHHNSMSTRYAVKDTLYPHLKNSLQQAVLTGQMSPYEFAIIEDWYIAISSDHKEKSYGYLGALTETELVRANQLRSQIGLRSVETRNKLIDIEQQTGMDFYLPGRPQLNGKIRIIQP